MSTAGLEGARERGWGERQEGGREAVFAMVNNEVSVELVSEAIMTVTDFNPGDFKNNMAQQ